LICLSEKYPAFPKIFAIVIKNQILQRTVEQHNLKLRIEPWEKHSVHECAVINQKITRFFDLVSPKTILYLWKNYIAKGWTFKHKKKPGRPSITKAIKEQILKMKNENFTWGARRIRDELDKLCIDLSHETINKILHHYRKIGKILPNLSWKHFLSANWKTLYACDFLTATIFSMKTYYIFFIIELKTRRIVQYSITTNPNIRFLRNQFSEFEYNYPGSFLIHDNSAELRWFPFEQYKIRDVRTVPYSPDMNAYAERFVRSIRNECLDYFIIFTEGQLCRIIKGYIEYYNNYRPHQGLKGIPNGNPEQGSKTGAIRKKPLLFGLHNHYYREAA
jgi:transposase